MKKLLLAPSRRLILPLAALMLPPALSAQTITKANNTTVLNDPASWVGGVVPGTGDIALWNNTVTAANNSALGGNLSVLGLQIANPTGAITISATAGATLTLGASGIDMSAATQDLTIGAALTLGTAQEWNVGTRTLTVTSALTDGGNALTFTGTGNYRGGTNNAFGTGTLNLNNNLTFSTNDGTARTFANTLVNVGGNIAFGQTTGGTGALTFNGAGVVFDLGSASRTFTVNQATTINGAIQSATAGVGLTKAGGAILTLGSPATYSGTTNITGGTLRVASDFNTSLPNSNVVFGGNSTYILTTASTFNVTLGSAATQLQFGAFNSGFAALNNNTTLTFNGGDALTWGQGGFVQSNTQLLFGANGGTHSVIIPNAIDLSATAGSNGTLRTIAPSDNGAVFEGELGGNLSGQSGLLVSGSGALRLSGASLSYQGGTFVTNGVLGYNPASVSSPANLSTGAIESIVNVSSSTSTGVAYTGSGAVPASFFSGIGNFGSAITVAAFSPTNNASGNYSSAVDFTLAPAEMQSKLYLGAVASSTAMATAGFVTLTGTLTPAGGTYRLGGGNGMLVLGTANQLTGANNVVVRTGGTVRVNNAAQNLTGTIAIDGGIFEINGNGANISSAGGIVVNGVGSLASATSVNGYGSSTTFFARLRGGVLGLQNMKDPTGALVGAQMITLRGGAIAAHDSDGNAGSILVQNVTADYGYNQIAHQPQGAGSTHDQLTITNLTRNTGASVEFRSQFGPLATTTGDNGNINVTTINGVATANMNNILGGWAVASEGAASTTNNGDARNFATLTANGIDAYTQEYTTAAAKTLATAGAGANVLATGTAGGTASAFNVVSSDLTINSLITEAAVNVMNNAVLTIGSGGLIMRQTQNFFHSTDNTGKLTSGLPTGELFVYGDPATNDDHRITSIAIVDNGATAVSLIKGGTGSITIGGTNQDNTFSGPIVVNLGLLRIDYRGTGSVLPSGAGNTITIRSGGTFSTALNNSAPVTVPNNITIDGGTLTNEPTFGPTSSTVTYSGTITVNSLAGSSAFINSNAAAGNSMILGPTATLTGSGNLTKNGGQAFDIQTPNTTGFTGTVYINSGNFQASGGGILPNTDYYLAGGTLGVTTTAQTVKNLTGTGGAISGDSTVTTDSLTVVQTIDGAYHGSISQTKLIKQGDAHLYLAGGGDNGSGTVQMEAGILTLAKASTNGVHSIGSGGVGLTINGGTVRFGGNYTNTAGGGTNLPPANAPANYVDQIYFDTDIVLNGGTLDMNGMSESIDGFNGAAAATITNGVASTTSIFYSGQNGTAGTFAGTLQDGAGTLSYVKLGNGTQTLSGNNTYTGPTEVRGGTLSVTGSASGSVFTVKTAATLIGDGPIGGLVTEAGASVSPGVGTGIASLGIAGNLTLGGGTLTLALNGTGAGTGYDQLSASGTVSLTSDTTLTLTLGFTPVAGVDSFVIVDNTGIGAVAGTGHFVVGGVPLNDGDTFLLGGTQFQIQYDGGTGNDIVLAAVPEPGSALSLLGALSVLGIRRRRK